MPRPGDAARSRRRPTIRCCGSTLAAGLGAFGGRRGRRAALRGVLAIGATSAISSGCSSGFCARRRPPLESFPFVGLRRRPDVVVDAVGPRGLGRRVRDCRGDRAPDRWPCRSARWPPRSRTRASTTACIIPATWCSAARSASASRSRRRRCGRAPTTSPAVGPAGPAAARARRRRTVGRRRRPHDRRQPGGPLRARRRSRPTSSAPRSPRPGSSRSTTRDDLERALRDAAARRACDRGRRRRRLDQHRGRRSRSSTTAPSS